MPSAASAEDLIRIGRAQIDQANSKKLNTVPQKNRPELAATGVRNSIEGKIKRNLAADVPIGSRGTVPGASIQNANGTSSSEQTISIGFDGKTVLIPTVIPDKDGFLVKRSDEDAIRLFKAGKNPSVGTFDSIAEADTFAAERSASGGRSQTNIPALTDTILAAASGQPLGTSISAQKEGQANARLLLQFLIGQQQQEQEEGTPDKNRSVAKEGSASSSASQDQVSQLTDEEVNKLLKLLSKEGTKKETKRAK